MIADILLVLASFLITSKLYQGAALPAIAKYQSPFMVFVILFLTVSFIFNKYELRKVIKFLPMLSTYAKALLITAGISGLAIYFFQLGHYSRFIILGTMLGIAILEFLWIALFQVIQQLFMKRNKNTLQ